MQTEIATMVMIQVVAMLGIFVFTILYFSREVKPFKRLVPLIESVAGTDEAVQSIATASNSLVEIGTSAAILNNIFQDEELLEGLVTQVAQKAVKIFQMSMLGTKSGDSRKMVKAEGLVNEAMIEGAKKLNPIIGVILKTTGLDEELRKDPEMFGYIMQIIQEKGLLNLLDTSALSMPSTAPETDSTGPKGSTEGVEF